jgi:hypothetical protein
MYRQKDLEKLFFSPEWRITILDSGEIRCENRISCELSDHKETITFVRNQGKLNKATLMLNKN